MLSPLPRLAQHRRPLKPEDSDEFVLEISLRKLAVVVTGRGRIFIADPAPFRWSIKRGTLDVLRFGICGRVRSSGPLAAIGYRRSVHSAYKSGLRRSVVVPELSPRASFVRDRKQTRLGPTSIHPPGLQRPRQRRLPNDAVRDVQPGPAARILQADAKNRQNPHLQNPHSQCQVATF